MKSLLILAALGIAAGSYLLLRPASGSSAEATHETRAEPVADDPGGHTKRRVEAVGQLGPGDGTVLIELKAPKGGKLTEGAPVSVRGSGNDIRVSAVKHALKTAKLPLRVPVHVADGATGPVELQLSFYWCREHEKAGSGACSPEKGSVVVDLDLTGDAAGGEAFFRYEVR